MKAIDKAIRLCDVAKPNAEIPANAGLTEANITKALGIKEIDFEITPVGFGENYKDYRVTSKGKSYVVRKYYNKRVY